MSAELPSWAIVTGASAGMGADFARALAAAGYGLLITARREAELAALRAAILAERPGARIDFIAGDLTDKATREKLIAFAETEPVTVLVNNAGFGPFGAFDAMTDETEETLIGLNVGAVAHLTRRIARAMKARGTGYILETSSIAAFQPSPLYAAYGATKAFVLSYGLAARRELKGTGVSVTVLCPGVTATEFFAVAKQDKLSAFQRLTMRPSAAVVSGALRALFRRKAVYVPGLLNRINGFAVRFLPRTWAAAAAETMLRP
jgi:short-subunit dehydrogenase